MISYIYLRHSFWLTYLMNQRTYIIDNVIKTIKQRYNLTMLSKYITVSSEDYLTSMIKCASLLQCNSQSDPTRLDIGTQSKCSIDYERFLRIMSKIIRKSPDEIDLDIMRCMAFQAALIVNQDSTL